jgi:ribosomal protein S18 acetylase RimI-like enzyme
LRIRDAVPADAAAIAAMIHELIAFEESGVAPSFTVDQLASALTDPPRRLRAIIAEDPTGIAGFISYTIDFAIWTGGEVLRIDDVFVRARARGRGVGRSLMLHVASIAVHGQMPCRWEIEPGNEGAQRFYRSLGVEIRDKKTAQWNLAAMRDAHAQDAGGSNNGISTDRT